MPIFEIERPDGSAFEVEAPDYDSAIQALEGPQQTTQQLAQGAPVSGWDDFKTQLGVGGVEAAASIPGMAGDIADIGDEYFSGGRGQSSAGKYLPATEDVMGGIERVTGVDFPEPQTGWGTTGRIIGNLSPLGGVKAKVMAGKRAFSAAVNATPSVGQLKSMAANLYKRAKNSGVVFNAQDYDNLVADIGQTIVDEGADVVLHPKAVRTVQGMAEFVGGPMNAQDMHSMRRRAKAAANSADPDERRLGQIIKNKIDNFIEPAIPELTEANRLWHLAKSGEEIEEVIRRGERKGRSVFTQSGPENAIRRGFEHLASNEKRMRRFGPRTKQAIEDVATKGAISRGIGKLAPTSVISGAPGGVLFGAGWYNENPEMMMQGGALAGLGAGARMLATRATRGRARVASALARGMHGPRVAPPKMNPLAYLTTSPIFQNLEEDDYQ